LRERTPASKPVCLISGGEFACPVRGSGIGGRNAETVLRWAIELDKMRSSGTATKNNLHFVVLSGGTDGIDGNSPAAGAITDEHTLERARALGLDAQKFLDQSDAYTFFYLLNQTLEPGPTGTNVRDLRIMLAR
jgi:glycerate-2-kinase